MARKRLTDADLRAKIAKCPAWMQEIANAALAERDHALKQLADFGKKQNASKRTPFFVETYTFASGKHETVKTYIDTDEIKVVHCGVELEIRTRANNTRDGKGIELSYSREDGMLGEIAMVAKHYNALELRLPENCRQLA
jgi:glycine cleavage system pyridoxal-binding protein P